MRQVRSIYGLVIHISGGRLYGIMNISQQDYGEIEAWK